MVCFHRKLISLFLGLLLSFTASAAFLPPAISHTAMVTTAQAAATKVGIKILKAGGNAVDAAVAIGYALAVVQPCCGNLGGGGFMLLHLANGDNVFINFREKAPALIKSQHFLDKAGQRSEKAIHGYLAVGVPGTVMGLNTALKKYGTMSLKQVMAPAISLARHGFLLRHDNTKNLNKAIGKKFKRAANITAIFPKQHYQIGERIKQPQLANTLRLISDEGSTGLATKLGSPKN